MIMAEAAGRAAVVFFCVTLVWSALYVVFG